MIWNGLSNDERLQIWKNLRKDISGLSFDSQLQEIAKFYSLTPFGSRTIDYYDPTSWPTPWEILFYGSFCKSSISLMIFYTICIILPDCNAKIVLVDDNNDLYLLPVIEDQFVLNLVPGVISNYQELTEEVKIIHVFEKEFIKKIN